MEIKLINPVNCKIEGVQVLPKAIHFDPRGFLVESLRSDDARVEGEKFVMTYTSMTPAGVARDENRWHYHKEQVDRFIIPLGEIALALFDNRENSPSAGLCQVLNLNGSDFDDFERARSENSKFDLETYMVTVPIGVYHCYKNIGKNFVVMQNFPTQLYNPKDEGRAFFSQVPVKSLGDANFSWDLIKF